MTTPSNKTIILAKITTTATTEVDLGRISPLEVDRASKIMKHIKDKLILTLKQHVPNLEEENVIFEEVHTPSIEVELQ